MAILRRFVSCGALGVVGVLAASCAGSDSGPAPAATKPTGNAGATESVAVSVPPPGPQLVDVPGPYHIGVTTITVADVSRDRTLTVYVWFPIDDPGTAPNAVYDGSGVSSYPSPMAVNSSPSSISTNGPFPLVVVSHGHLVGGFDYSGYAEALASYGYVVAAPNHLGDSALDPPGAKTGDAQNLLDRPQDLSAVITEMLNVNNSQTAAFAANIDPDKIATMGHSRGGSTVLAVVAGYSNELGESTPDPRVKAIVALAPGADATRFSDARLAAVTVPTMMIVGADDDVAPVDPNVTRPWALVSGRPLYRIELVAGRHMTLGQFCHYLDYWATVPNLPKHSFYKLTVAADGACDPGAMPIARADALTNTFVIRFLDSVFRGEPPLESTFAPVPTDVIFMVK